MTEPAERQRGPTDLRLVPAAGAAWASAGFGTRLAPVAALSLAGGVLIVVLVLLALRGGRRDGPEPRRRTRPWLPALISSGAVAVLVLLSVAAQLGLRSAGLLPDLIERRAAVVADVVVRSDPREVRQDADERARDQGPRFTVLARADYVTGRGHSGDARAAVLVIGDERWSKLRPGERVRVHGRLVPADPGDDVTALLMPSRPPVLLAGAGPVQRRAEQLRAGLRDAAAGLTPDSAGLLPGLVVGDTSRLPPDLEDAMRVTGLTHLTAVSGSNVAIVSGTVLLVAGACGAGRRLRVLLAFAGLLGFVVLARPDPSVLRAGVMGAVGLVGLVHARRGQGMPALCTAVIALTIADPWLGRAFGFALSVLATSGLLLLARPWAAALNRLVPLPVAHAVAVPAAAQAVSAPVVVLLAPQLSLSAVPANLLVAPAVAPATVLGVVATLVAPLWPGAAAAVAWGAGWCTWWIAAVARTAAALPGSAVPWPEGGRGALLLAAATLLAVLLAPALIGGLARLDALARRDQRTGRRVGRRVVAVAAVGALLGVLLLWPQSPLAQRLSGGWPPKGWRMVACDVGQGDAFVVATGPRSAALFDTGPDPESVDRCLGRLGIQTLDLLVVTHFHADHAGGITGALRGRAVKRLLVSPLPEPAASAKAVEKAARDAGVAVEVATAGLQGENGDVRWQVLSPKAPRSGGVEEGRGSPSESVSRSDGESSDTNNASLVLFLEVAGLRVLTTGDVEQTAQAALRRTLAAAPALLPVDVLKVSHHGSANQDPGLHEAIAPRVALISAGKDNDYGHPAPVTLDLLDRVGAMGLRTDQLGDVAVGGDGASLWVAGRQGTPEVAPAAAPSACLAEPKAGPARCRPGVAPFARGKSSIVTSIGPFDLAERRTGTRRARHGHGGSAGRSRCPTCSRRAARAVP